MLSFGSQIHITHKITFIAHQNSIGTTENTIFFIALCQVISIMRIITTLFVL
jgi:hypothetical protein